LPVIKKIVIGIARLGNKKAGYKPLFYVFVLVKFVKASLRSRVCGKGVSPVFLPSGRADRVIPLPFSGLDEFDRFLGRFTAPIGRYAQPHFKGVKQDEPH